MEMVTAADMEQLKEILRAEIREEYESRIASLQGEVDQLRSTVAQQKEMKNIPNESSSVEKKEELAPILQSKLMSSLPKISSNLDPKSFARFIRSSMRLCSLAEQGLISCPLKLNCTWELEPGIPSFSYNGEMLFTWPFAKVEWARPEVNILNLGVRPVPSRFVQRRPTNLRHSKLLKLLDFAEIRIIDTIIIYGNVGNVDFLQNYKIRALDAQQVSSDFLSFCNKLELEDLTISFGRHGRPTTSDIARMILNSHYRHLKLTGVVVSSELIFVLVKEWINGTRVLNSIEFQVTKDGEGDYQLTRMISCRCVNDYMKDLDLTAVKKLAGPLLPAVLRDKDNNFIVIRKDGKAVRGIYDNKENFSQIKIEKIM